MSLMPTLFTAHGNPMNALGGTTFSRFLEGWAEDLPRPRAILCISAHWERHGLAVTMSLNPETIHDFYGFPKELYLITYSAKGEPEVGEEVIALLGSGGYIVDRNKSRGLDHGTWAPLRFLYPDADIPVLQLSLPVELPLPDLFTIGELLATLRDLGVLIIGSGNLVHNLSRVDYERRDARVLDWAHSFDADVKEWVLTRDHKKLGEPWMSSPVGRISHPTLEHYAPLLVAMGAGGSSPVTFPFEGFEHGSISMRSVRFG